MTAEEFIRSGKPVPLTQQAVRVWAAAVYPAFTVKTLSGDEFSFPELEAAAKAVEAEQK